MLDFDVVFNFELFDIMIDIYAGFIELICDFRYIDPYGEEK